MAHYSHTPRMAPPMLGPQPVLYATVGTSPYQGTRHYHVAASEPSRSRGHHRSSSRSRDHRRPHSSSGRHHRHHHRSSTPTHYSPAAHYSSIPPVRHRRHSHSVPNHHQRSSSRGPRSGYYGHPEHHLSHRGESIGERIKRFFGLGGNKVRFVDPSGHPVDRFGRPIYAL